MKVAALLAAIGLASAQAACPFGHDHGRALRAFEPELKDDYNSQSAAEKFEYLRQKIASTPDSAPWPNTLELAGLFTESMGVTEDLAADEFEQSWIFQRKKLIHSVGYVAEAKIEWKENPYTGLFQGANTGFIRFSSAKEPDYSKSDSEAASFTPGFGVKFLRDGVPSGNIVSLASLMPRDSWNFFKYPTSNHLSIGGLDTALSLLAKKFATAPSDWAGYIGLNDFARYGEDGTEVSDDELNFPFQLVFYPNEDLQKAYPDTGAGHDLYTTQLQQLQAGQHLYSVHAKDTHDSPLVHIGDIYQETEFAPSAYGDQTMFLQHTRYDDDLKLRPELLQNCEDIQSCKVCPTEIDC